MDTFGFTKKKLLALSLESQSRHIIIWLSGFYQKLTTNRVNPASLDLFARQYNEILAWIEMTPFIKPESNHTSVWIEIISDQIHLHRTVADSTARDYDLLKKVQTIDRTFFPSQINFHCHVALDGIRSLFNVGSIFRTCEAAGFESIILGNTLGKEHPNVRKTAMGAHKWVEQEKTDDLAQTLIEKKKKDFKIIGVETIKDACPYNDMSWKKNTIIVFGNEEYGISKHVRQICDTFVYIPMFGKKNSINIANAVSVICFQVAGSLSGKRLCS